ncbi:MAG TPA: histidinol-phosphate transaminase [Bacillota bacterium]|nr:histidinol-phosphate transaminase [Clostridiales bacterium]HPT85506.1 histidinol-phosphate transaminase [Bacillota bacterium]
MTVSSAAFIPEKIAKLKEYVPVEADVPVKLDSNENPYPMPEPLRARLCEIAGTLEYNRYPDPYARELVGKFAKVYGVKPERVVAGCGSDEVLHLLCQALIYDGAAVATAPPDFSMYAFYAYLEGGRVITSSRGADGRIDFCELARLAKSDGCRCVMFSNPCNPTGAVATRDEMLDFVRNAGCPVVVDEAYGEFSGREYSVLDMAGELPNLIVLKTLSKAFGLAGLRVGFAVAHEDIVRAVKKVKSPYNLNAFSQAAGAAALEYAGEIFALAEKIGKAAKELYKKLHALSLQGGYEAVEPGANFVLLKFFDAADAERVHAELLRRGISVRLLGGALRITCGTDAENEKFYAEFERTIKGGITNERGKAGEGDARD